MNIDTSFDDTAQSKYADFCPAEAGKGPFRGNEPLSNFNGQNSLGVWTLAVENNGSDSRGGFVVGFSVTITGTAQTAVAVAPDGIRNSASPFVLDQPIAPGEVISIFGYNLGPQQPVTAPGPNWPTWTDGTVVRVNGQDAPMRFISFYRVDVEVPTGLDLSKNARLSVLRGGVSTNEVEVPVARVSPGIFTVNQIGVGQAEAKNSDGTANSQSNPVARGNVVTVYANGLGPTEPVSSEGQPASGEVDFLPIAPITARIGGVAAEVKKAALAPGKVAVFAVDIVVPPGIDPGVAEVIIGAGSASSQAGATIQVK